MPHPPSTDLYAFLDCEMAALSPAARLIVQTTRDWRAAAANNLCPSRMIAPRLILAGKAALLSPLHQLLVIIAQGQAHPFGPPPAPAHGPSDDEAQLLAGLAAAQSGKAQQVRYALAPLVRPRYLAEAVHAAILLSTGLRGSDGLVWAKSGPHRQAA